uniref:Uncharacterized protein n=1 Tax=Cyanistes caeruleus TaxID=156563 RepID=A0A8C0V6I8_CYACU
MVFGRRLTLILTSALSSGFLQWEKVFPSQNSAVWHTILLKNALSK